MPKFARRKLVFSASAAMAAAVVFANIRPGGFLAARRLDTAASDQFSEIFGPEILAMPASQSFVSDYVLQLSERSQSPVPNKMALAFLQSSNLIEHHETGVDLEYAELFDPYDLPCSNRLGANYAFEAGAG